MNDLEQGRLRREWRTLDAMIRIRCRAQHRERTSEGGLCEACTELRAYARKRLERCPFGVEKPTCANCRVHCYRAAPRAEVRDVMRFAGPRMLVHHPILALLHLLVDERRPAPDLAPRATSR